MVIIIVGVVNGVKLGVFFRARRVFLLRVFVFGEGRVGFLLLS